MVFFLYMRQLSKLRGKLSELRYTLSQRCLVHWTAAKRQQGICGAAYALPPTGTAAPDPQPGPHMVPGGWGGGSSTSPMSLAVTQQSFHPRKGPPFVPGKAVLSEGR